MVQPPTPPSDVRIGGEPETDAMVVGDVNHVVLSARLWDPEAKQACHLVTTLSVRADFDTHRTFVSDPVPTGSRTDVVLDELEPGTRYYVRSWSMAADGRESTNYNSANFWTTHTDGGGGGGGGGGGTTGAPSPPSQVEINGEPEQDGLVTGAVGKVTVTGVVWDPVAKKPCHLLAMLSVRKGFESHRTFIGQPVASGHRAAVVLDGLEQNTLYYLRLYTVSATGLRSDYKVAAPAKGYMSTTFWMNRSPGLPTLYLPAENEQIPANLTLTFEWQAHDPDGESADQYGFELKYRTSATLADRAGVWHLVTMPTETDESWVAGEFTFHPGTFYDWTVRTKDVHGLWGKFAVLRSFYISGVTTPPRLIRPTDDRAVDPAGGVFFNWRFMSQQTGVEQVNADLRWRVVGEDESAWLTVLGDEHWQTSWTISGDQFAPHYHYEWQVRTYDSAGNPASGWSEHGRFWTIRTPGWSLGDGPLVDPDQVEGSLGCGAYRVFVYDQGAQVLRGEITPFVSLAFTRLRDDISNCLVWVQLADVSQDRRCLALLGRVRCWMHELVVFRDGERVWEGPVTRIAYHPDKVEFEARDPLVYLSRRVMRQGYSDAYRIVDGEEVGLHTVVERAELIAINSLAPYDPNLLPYLTTYKFPDDARQSRVIPDMSQTAWEQIDDLASTAGLDYTCVGRRIVFWDTHRAIGRLPMLTDRDFLDSPVVTEYGMNLCNFSVVTDGNGIWAAVRPHDEQHPNQAYGPVEMVASAYGNAVGKGVAPTDPAAIQRMEESMTQQAYRNIAHRWPTPLVVRIPDNTTLSPDAQVGFSQLVPGVWIPLRSMNTIRDVTQWQKLDSIHVASDATHMEQVTVVLSPAPNGGQNPDSGAGEEE